MKKLTKCPNFTRWKILFPDLFLRTPLAVAAAPCPHPQLTPTPTTVIIACIDRLNMLIGADAAGCSCWEAG